MSSPSCRNERNERELVADVSGTLAVIADDLVRLAGDCRSKSIQKYLLQVSVRIASEHSFLETVLESSTDS